MAELSRFALVTARLGATSTAGAWPAPQREFHGLLPPVANGRRLPLPAAARPDVLEATILAALAA